MGLFKDLFSSNSNGERVISPENLAKLSALGVTPREVLAAEKQFRTKIRNTYEGLCANSGVSSSVGNSFGNMIGIMGFYKEMKSDNSLEKLNGLVSLVGDDIYSILDEETRNALRKYTPGINAEAMLRQVEEEDMSDTYDDWDY